MEASFIKYATSIILIALGVFYYLKPDKAQKLIRFPVTYIKYSGIALIFLGIYYLLVLLKVLPMFNY